jgi:hypothetical protein
MPGTRQVVQQQHAANSRLRAEVAALQGKVAKQAALLEELTPLR